jgi:hypothetical protein
VIEEVAGKLEARGHEDGVQLTRGDGAIAGRPALGGNAVCLLDDQRSGRRLPELTAGSRVLAGSGGQDGQLLADLLCRFGEVSLAPVWLHPYFET